MYLAWTCYYCRELECETSWAAATSDITEEAIARSEQIFGPVKNAASETTPALCRVPLEPTLIQFSLEVQVAPLFRKCARVQTSYVD